MMRSLMAASRALACQRSWLLVLNARQKEVSVPAPIPKSAAGCPGEVGLTCVG